MEHLDKQNRYEYLANEWKNKTISEEEELELIKWLDVYKEEGLQISTEMWKSEAELKNEIYQNIQRAIKPKAARKIRLWPRAMAVAGATVAVVFGVWFFYSTVRPEHLRVQSAQDIGPGKHTARLTLANGKVIELSDAKTGVVINRDKLAYNDGSQVEEGVIADQTIVASTPRGGTYMVILPDGTKVWLNAASSLKFPAHFGNSPERKVELNGEAYFEVFKSEKQAFIVESASQQVEVLGTHFNINSYSDESSIKTTLLEGSVRIAFQSPRLSVSSSGDGRSDLSGGERASVMLKPNQQAILNRAHQINVVPADMEAVMGWKNGDFVFGGGDLKSVMREITRWYGVTVKYDISDPADIKLDGWISRSSNLSVVLRRIESIGNLHFKLEGRSVTVTK